MLFIMYFAIFLSLDFSTFLQRHLISHWTDLLASFSGLLISIAQPNVTVVKNVIIDELTHVAVSVLPGCNAVEACGLLISGMLSFPTTWKARICGALTGTVAVQSVNILRIISLFFLAGWSETMFEFAHKYIWQALIMLDVLIVWLLWIRYLFRNELVKTKNTITAHIQHG